MKAFGMCINLKVVAALAAAGAVVWVVAPGAVAAALPLLAVLVCPLSMLVMMRAMSGGASGSQSSTGLANAARGPAAEQLGAEATAGAAVHAQPAMAPGDAR